jgi:hypothetical protein
MASKPNADNQHKRPNQPAIVVATANLKTEAAAAASKIAASFLYEGFGWCWCPDDSEDEQNT